MRKNEICELAKAFLSREFGLTDLDFGCEFSKTSDQSLLLEYSADCVALEMENTLARDDDVSDNDIVTNDSFKIPAKRKNCYLISMIYELSEAYFFKECSRLT